VEALLAVRTSPLAGARLFATPLPAVEDPSRHLPWAVAVFPEGVLVAAVAILVVASQEEVAAGVVAK